MELTRPARGQLHRRRRRPVHSWVTLYARGISPRSRQVRARSIASVALPLYLVGFTPTSRPFEKTPSPQQIPPLSIAPVPCPICAGGTGPSSMASPLTSLERTLSMRSPITAAGALSASRSSSGAAAAASSRAHRPGALTMRPCTSSTRFDDFVVDSSGQSLVVRTGPRRPSLALADWRPPVVVGRQRVCERCRSCGRVILTALVRPAVALPRGSSKSPARGGMSATTPRPCSRA